METNRIFPDNWKDVIRGKKVILYNTGVTSLLQGRETRIEKMKWVFDVFKEHPEVVLWWRPHPLEVSTVHSMLPELEKQYMEVRRQYVEEGIGILDESVDLNRAIAISDAYYGAFSSMVELYKAAKKPVLYEDNKVRKTEEAVFLPASLCVRDNFIWFIQLNSNKLVKVNKATFEVEKIINIDGEPSFRRRVYNYHIIDAGSSLLLFLGGSNQIYEYEINMETIRAHKPRTDNFIFHSEIVIKTNDKLLMFPYGSTDVLFLDYRTDVVQKKSIAQRNIKAAKCYKVIDTKVYMTDSDSNTLYQYDIAGDSCMKKRIGAKENRYWGVIKAGRYFVLPHLEKRAISLWDEESGQVIELTKFPDQYAYLEGNAYLEMFEKNGDIYIFPFYANMILKVDIENKRIVQAFAETYLEGGYNRDSKSFSDCTYLSAMRYKDFIYTYAINKKCWQIFDLNTLTIQESSTFEIKSCEHKKMFELLLDSSDKAFCEGESSVICNLDNYISNLLYYDTGNIRKDFNNNRIGVKTYESLISEL